MEQPHLIPVASSYPYHGQFEHAQLSNLGKWDIELQNAAFFTVGQYFA